MLHFIRALSSFSTLPDLMRMAVRQGKHLSALLKAEIEESKFVPGGVHSK